MLTSERRIVPREKLRRATFVTGPGHSHETVGVIIWWPTVIYVLVSAYRGHTRRRDTIYAPEETKRTWQIPWNNNFNLGGNKWKNTTREHSTPSIVSRNGPSTPVVGWMKNGWNPLDFNHDCSPLPDQLPETAPTRPALRPKQLLVLFFLSPELKFLFCHFLRNRNSNKTIYKLRIGDV